MSKPTDPPPMDDPAGLIEAADGVFILPQPTTADVHRLARRGVRTLINLRHAGEDARPLSIAAEGDLARRLGMDYVNLPVSMKTADAKLATAFETLLAAARQDGPVAVHCRLGQRAGALVLVAAARHLGWSGPHALDQAPRLGLAHAVEPATLRTYVVACLG